MDTFECKGWLHITVTEGCNVVTVKLKHEDDHVPYWKIDVPQDVQDFIRENLSMRPTQVSDSIHMNHEHLLILDSGYGMKS